MSFRPGSISKLLTGRAAAVVVLLGILAYSLFFSWFTISRAKNFNAGWYDLGIMSQTVWRAGHGYGFSFTNPESGPAGQHGLSAPRTAIHTDYLLFLLAPLSWFGRTADNLLILQAIVIGAGAWFVFRLARTLLKNQWLGFLLAWIYLLYPPLQFANLFEFHPVTLAVTFYLAAADAIIGNRQKLFWLWTALALISKEQVGITFGLMAGALWWWRREKKLAWWSLGLSWLWAALQLLLVIPLSRSGAGTSFVFGKFYATAGDDAGSVLKSYLDPRAVWDRLATRTHLHNLLQLFAPLGYVLPLFGLPLLMLMAPEMLIYWLSDSPNQQTLFLHYQALFIPFLFLGLIFGWRLVERLAGRWGRVGTIIVRWLLIAAVIAGTGQAVWKWSVWPWSPITRWPLVAWKERLAPQVDQALSLIPPRASVALTQNLGPRLSQRPVVKLLPTGVSDVEYIVILERKFDPNIPTNDKRLAEKVMLERLIPWLQVQPAYRQRYHHDRVWVFQRIGRPTEPEPTWPEGLLGR